MESRKKKSHMQKRIVVAVFALLLLIAVAAEAVKLMKPSQKQADLNGYFSMEDGSFPVVYNGELEGVDVRIQDDQVYLPFKYLRKNVNSRFYWDETEHILRYTFPEEVKTWTETDLYEGNPVLLEENANVYVQLAFAAQYTNVEYAFYKDPDYLVVRTDWSSRKEVFVSEKTGVRETEDIKSDVRQWMEAGDSAVLIEEQKDWTLVCTDEGIQGYVKNSDIDKVEDVSEAGPNVDTTVYPRVSDRQGICLVWHQVFSSSGVNELDAQLEGTSGINTISPSWFRMIDTKGNISSLADSAYVQKAHSRNIEVWAMVNNIDNAIYGDDLAEVLNVTTNRTALINNLMKETLKYGIDGINVDIESLPESAAYGFIQFIRELSVECRKEGIILSVDNYTPEPWTAHYFFEEQGVMADYLIIMAYDEHYNGSDPGSTASVDFVIDGIEEMMEEADSSKIINAVPFYSRLWTTVGDAVTSETMSMKDIQNYIQQNGLEENWNEDAGQNYVEKISGNMKQQLWVEDYASMNCRLTAVGKYPIAGIAAWRLGLDSADAWKAISEYLQANQ